MNDKFKFNLREKMIYTYGRLVSYILPKHLHILRIYDAIGHARMIILMNSHASDKFFFAFLFNAKFCSNDLKYKRIFYDIIVLPYVQVAVKLLMDKILLWKKKRISGRDIFVIEAKTLLLNGWMKLNRCKRHLADAPGDKRPWI